MEFPQPEYWTFPNQPPLRLYSYHHVREYEQDERMRKMANEGPQRYGRNTTGEHRCALDGDVLL